MGVDTVHPVYQERVSVWEKVTDVYAGEDVIKEKGVTYLPPSSGMVYDGMETGQPGRAEYDRYKMRALFHGFFHDAVDTLTGIMHSKPPHIELPEKMQYLLKTASADSESLEMVARRITKEQLHMGRTGILMDVPSGQGPTEAKPYFAIYRAESIRNWYTGKREEGETALEFLVLDETGYEQEADTSWREVRKYRILKLSEEGVYQTALFTEDENGGFDINDPNVEWVTPQIGGRSLTRIPFFFVNVSDLAAMPDMPPLLGLANLDLAIYRGEADYRQSLHMQGQETLVMSGVDIEEGEEKRVGAGAYLALPLEGRAEYIGVSAGGLGEQAKALESDKDSARQQGSRMLSTRGGDQQSGDALRTRVAAQTASLPNMAKAMAEALNDALILMAEWLQASTTEVKFEPNLEFTAEELKGREVLELMQAKAMGAPISMQSLHRLFKRKNLTERSYEDEMDEIETEDPVMPADAGAMGGFGGANNGVGGGLGDGAGDDGDSE